MEENRCSVCGSILAAGDTLCPNCGSPVVTEPTAPAATEAAEPVAPVVTEPTAPVAAEPVAPVVTEPTAPVAAEPVAPAVTEPTAPVAAEPTASAVNLTKPSGETVSEETTVLSGNPGYQASGVYNPSNTAYNATYQDIPMDSTNYQGVYSQNTGVYTQTAEEPKKNSGKGLGIAAMIVGLASILCCPGGSILGIIGIILAIICMAKKSGKPFSIVGLITSIIGFVIGIIILVSAVTGAGVVGEIMDESGLGSSEYTSNPGSSSGTVVSVEQMIVNGDVYTIPGTLSSMGLTVSDNDSDVVESITTDGIVAGDYEFVELDSDNGYSLWGYIENTGDSTVYSVDELQVTGLNVDNFSEACAGNDVTVYGGVTLNMSREEVEDAIGLPDGEESGLDIYENVSGDTYLRVKYDDYGYVTELDITYYTY